MPLGRDVGRNIRELMADNKKKGKEKGSGGKARKRSQILAIALKSSGKSKY